MRLLVCTVGGGKYEGICEGGYDGYSWWMNSNLAWMRVGYGVRLVVGGILLWCVSEVRCGYILQEEIKSLQRSRKCSRCKQDHAIVHLCTVLYEQRSSHRDRPLPNPSSLFQMKYIKNGKKKSSLEQSGVVKKVQ